LLPDTAHFVQTSFKPIQTWCIPVNNVNTVNMCLSAHKTNWPEASGSLFFTSPQCNGNLEKTKPEEGQAATYLASMQNERTED
jgi:hypothetical protein